MREEKDALLIDTIASPFDAQVMIPGSKSITNRALLLAALSRGRSTLHNVLFSEDTEHMLAALAAMGVSVVADKVSNTVRVEGRGGGLTPPGHALYLGNSGTCMRFLTAACAAAKGEFLLDGNERMRQRPIQDLLDGLQALGVDATSVEGTGCPPVRVTSKGLPGGNVSMDGSTSSQYFSALLMAAPLATSPITITIDGELVSRPYVQMTVDMMSQFGGTAWLRESTIGASPGGYSGMELVIESDLSSASYFMAAAAMTGSRIVLREFPGSTLQGDIAMVDILREMGAEVFHEGGKIIVEGPATLNAIDVDMFHCSDLFPTVSVMALFARGFTRIQNVQNVRFKESDRLSAMATELAKLGAQVTENKDGLEITGEPSLHGARLATYDDHRIAMALALVGLRVTGVVIEQPGCVAKTFPAYFDALGSLRG